VRKLLTLSIIKLGIVYTTILSVPGKIASYRNFFFFWETSYDTRCVLSKYFSLVTG